MEEKPSNTCRAVVAARSDARFPPDGSSLPYFFTVTVSQQKIRIRIPKFLARTVHRRGSQLGDGSNVTSSSVGCPEEDRKRSATKGKAGGIWSHAFSKKRSGACKRDGCVELLGSGVEPTRVVGESQYENDGENDGCKMNKNGGGGCRRHSVTSKAKSDGRVMATCATAEAGTPWASSSSFGGSSKFTTIISRILTTRPRLKMTRSLRNIAGNPRLGGKAVAASEDEAGSGRGHGEELCEKKILMGEKCKPLNHSGVLEHDEEGILPLDSFFEETFTP